MVTQFTIFPAREEGEDCELWHGHYTMLEKKKNTFFYIFWTPYLYVRIIFCSLRYAIDENGLLGSDNAAIYKSQNIILDNGYLKTL